MVCAECGKEVDVYYEYDGDWLCEECLLEAVPKATAEELEDDPIDIAYEKERDENV